MKRILKGVALLALLGGCGGGGEPKAELVQARLVPWTNPDGRSMKMVLTDWRNTGTAPISKVSADITLYDAGGNRLSTGAPIYSIYTVSSSSPGIAPGETYTEPQGEGYAVVSLPSEGEAARVEVKITRVSSEGM